MPVRTGFWAPLGTALPERCPTSGFYCPGAARDTQHGGTKPIIIPVGSTVTTEEVRAVAKSMTLDVSIDSFVAQREAFRAAFAAQYRVDPSLISLEVAAGSLRLTVTIAGSVPSTAPRARPNTTSGHSKYENTLFHQFCSNS